MRIRAVMLTRRGEEGSSGAYFMGVMMASLCVVRCRAASVGWIFHRAHARNESRVHGCPEAGRVLGLLFLDVSQVVRVGTDRPYGRTSRMTG